LVGGMDNGTPRIVFLTGTFELMKGWFGARAKIMLCFWEQVNLKFNVFGEMSRRRGM
jgi:hypothetical protein